MGNSLAGLSVRCPQVPATARLKGISPAGPALRMHCPDCIRQRLTPRVHRPDCAWRRLAWFLPRQICPVRQDKVVVSRNIGQYGVVGSMSGNKCHRGHWRASRHPFLHLGTQASGWVTLRMRRMASAAEPIKTNSRRSRPDSSSLSVIPASLSQPIGSTTSNNTESCSAETPRDSNFRASLVARASQASGCPTPAQPGTAKSPPKLTSRRSQCEFPMALACCW